MKKKNKLKINSGRILIAVAICFCLIGIAGAEDWLMFHHDLQHTGETTDVIKNPENLGLKWKFQTGSYVSSSPAVSGDFVYACSYDDYVYTKF